MSPAREPDDSGGIRAAEIVLPCPELGATLAFFTERLGFRVEAVHPADDPTAAVVSGHGLRLRLEHGTGAPGVLRLACRDPRALAADLGGSTELTAPNGTVLRLEPAEPPVVVPPLRPSLAVTRARDADAWKTGRAGMRYRDLVPDRQGGRFIASHIAIPGDGPVPDWVHYHRVRFQMIFCYRGSVRVVYEDQGEPFVLEPGDCVLQPPEIRHRVLESAGGLEVIEVGCPAEHETLADHALELPTAVVRPERDFGGQRFVRHVAAAAEWGPWRLPGFEARDTGIAEATDGLAGVRVARLGPGAGGDTGPAVAHHGELLLLFALEGTLVLDLGGRGRERLEAGDCAVVPPGLEHAVAEASGGLELLEVSLPALR